MKQKSIKMANIQIKIKKERFVANDNIHFNKKLNQSLLISLVFVFATRIHPNCLDSSVMELLYHHFFIPLWLKS